MSNGTDTSRRWGPVSWMAGNSVAANILMAVLLVGGFFTALKIKQEVFPDFNLDAVTISVAYPGASPEEVETGIILAVEEAVQDLEGIDEIRSTASEGSGTVTIEAIEGADVTQLWQEAKSEVDRIDTFPDEARQPNVSIASRRRRVMTLAFYGRADETVLRETAERVRDELLLDPDITQVVFQEEFNGNSIRPELMWLDEAGGGSWQAHQGYLIMNAKNSIRIKFQVCSNTNCQNDQICCSKLKPHLIVL